MKKILKFCFKIFAFLLIFVFIINIYMIFNSYFYIISKNTLKKKGTRTEAILILGAGIYTDKPSYILKERLDEGIELYKNGIAPKIIMTGDHGQKHYNEVQVMKNYAIEKGVPAEDIFMDHAGFSTYESIVRLKRIFRANSVIIVSQKYHLPRAIYLAKSFDINVFAVSADKIKYKGQWYRSAREVAARFKDFFMGIFKPNWYIGGDYISLNQSGEVTQD